MAWCSGKGIILVNNQLAVRCEFEILSMSM